MCDYTQVEYSCGHLRYIVKAWCTSYPETQKRCPLNVVEMSVFSFSSFFKNSDHQIDSMIENIESMRSVEIVAKHQQRAGLLRNGNLHLRFPSFDEEVSMFCIGTTRGVDFQLSGITGRGRHIEPLVIIDQ